MKPSTTLPQTPMTVLSAPSMGWPVLVARVAERFGLVDWLNTVMAWDPKPCRWSPGVRLLAIILCYLVDPQALYQVEAFYETLDGELMFGPGVHASDFNDDALGRALLKFHAAHPAQVYADLSARAIATYALPAVDAVHGDTTSLTLEGDYPAADAAVEPSPPPNATDAEASSVKGPVSPALTARPKRGGITRMAIARISNWS